MSRVKYRYENFGGIISGTNPPFLAFVDREYMRDIKKHEPSCWNTDDENIGLLSAPTEVHFSITNRCSAGCRHCYMESGAGDMDELDTSGFKKALDILAGMGVFHIAMGGGDALEREDLFALAEYAEKVGLVPNLTVSGKGITPYIAEKMKVFGQVNVSMDGTGAEYGIYRGNDFFYEADKAVDYLIGAGVPTGINTVVGCRNFDLIPSLFRYAAEKGVNEIEFLRFKPSGRGKDHYLREKTTHDQNLRLTGILSESSARHNIEAKIDCSFVPMFCYHEPPLEILEALATYGCEAGNVLFGIRSNGSVSGCSFLGPAGLSVFDLEPGMHHEKEVFKTFTSWQEKAAEPCRSCSFIKICKGGCHAVAKFVTGDYKAPDPDCPFVVDYIRKKG